MYETNPASGGPPFRSRLEGSEHVPGVEADERVLKSLVDGPTAGVTYVCEAAVGASLNSAVWRVRRITESGSTVLTEWAGTGDFDQIASNRTTLSYR